MTEFGKSLVLKTAGVVSKVEDKLAPPDPQLSVTVIAHAGDWDDAATPLRCLCSCMSVCMSCGG
jgi:hypothetical protein